MEIGKSKLLLIDTPGFDDSGRTDSSILTEISRLLSVQYELGVCLKGVIYLHRITDLRYAGSSVRTLEIFKKICRETALKNVLLVSTRWNELDEAVGAAREKRLRDDFWAFMLSNGSTMARFHGDRDSAIGIASQLISRQSIILELQRELVEEGKTLERTLAGAFVYEDVSEMRARYEQELRDLESLVQTLQTNDRTMRMNVQNDKMRHQEWLQKYKKTKIDCMGILQLRCVQRLRKLRRSQVEDGKRYLYFHLCWRSSRYLLAFPQTRLPWSLHGSQTLMLWSQSLGSSLETRIEEASAIRIIMYLRSRMIAYFFSFESVIPTHYEIKVAGFPVAEVARIKELT